eukprot:scaffold3588_cov67-Phaeocystis_antarctica.AAC.5
MLGGGKCRRAGCLPKCGGGALRLLRGCWSVAVVEPFEICRELRVVVYILHRVLGVKGEAPTCVGSRTPMPWTLRGSRAPCPGEAS